MSNLIKPISGMKKTEKELIYGEDYLFPDSGFI
jgi:hypothetical protein